MTNSEVNPSQAVTLFLIAGAVLLPWLMLIASEACLALYRRAVVRTMRDTVPLPPAPPAAAPAVHGATRPVHLDVEAADQSAGQMRAGGALYAQWRTAVKETTKVYVVAGGVYATVLTAAFAFRFRPLSWATVVVLVLTFSWPAVLTALLVAVPRRARQQQINVGYWILFFVAVAVAAESASALSGEGIVWLVGANVVATTVALVVRARRIRAVAPLVGAFFVLLGIGVAVFLGALMSVGQQPGAEEQEISGSQVAMVVALMLTLPVAAPFAGWRLLRGIGGWYAAKRTSDQTLTMASIWLIFAGVHASTIAYDDFRWMSVGLLAFCGFLVCTTIGFRVLRGRGERTAAPRLLVLRVFALGRRSRHLFDRLAARWRHVGSVQLIAGPDLASSTVEPHEFFDFLSRRLGNRFLANTQSIESALAALDTRPDHDGRYRITDFFCRDSVWQAVFARLAAKSDVVLMDLRGFSGANCGCTYELTELLNLVPLDRIAIVIDGSTDESFLAQTIEQASARIAPTSPNTATALLRVRLFRETRWRGVDPDPLLRLLCDTAAPDRAPAFAGPN
jgi:hypothetical protein